MPDYTPNYNLEQPFQEEYYNVDVQNQNMEKIDAALAKKAELGADGKIIARLSPTYVRLKRYSQTPENREARRP